MHKQRVTLGSGFAVLRIGADSIALNASSRSGAKPYRKSDLAQTNRATLEPKAVRHAA